MPEVLVKESVEYLLVRSTSETLVVRASSPEVLEVSKQGPAGPRGPVGGTMPVAVGSGAISGHSVVAIGPDGKLVYADCTLPAHLGAVVGLVDSAYAPGAIAVVQTGFDMAHSGWGFSAGPVFVGAGGALTQTLPVDALFSQVVGFAVSATRINISIQPPITIS